jgi:hypothetical protein
MKVNGKGKKTVTSVRPVMVISSIVPHFNDPRANARIAPIASASVWIE